MAKRPYFLDRDISIFPEDRDTIRDEWVNPLIEYVRSLEAGFRAYVRARIAGLNQLYQIRRLLHDYSQIDGDHHKAWVIDQIARVAFGKEYEAFVREFKDGEEGPDTYEWDEGIAPGVKFWQDICKQAEKDRDELLSALKSIHKEGGVITYDTNWAVKRLIDRIEGQKEES